MPRVPRSPRRAALAVFSVSPLLSGCITGERPTLVEAPIEAVDDPAIEAVTDRLDRAEGATFTATYDIIPSSTGEVTEATVVSAEDRRQVRIGEIEFDTDGSVVRTCTAGGDCADFLDDARISDLNITNEFWGDSFASRLRLDGSRRVAFSTGRTDTIAGQPAACVDVPVPGVQNVSAAVTYCALDAGPLARYFGADVSIELTSFSFVADPPGLDG